jgi:hypothetical protein
MRKITQKIPIEEHSAKYLTSTLQNSQGQAEVIAVHARLSVQSPSLQKIKIIIIIIINYQGQSHQ